MLEKKHKITIRFFDVGGGDAIWIRFLGRDRKWHNVLIDGGYGATYKTTFGPLITQITEAGEAIDLWVISHIDRDHIGAVLGFIQDKKIEDKPATVNQFWFNHTELTVNVSNGKLSVGDGIKFRDYLNANGLLGREAITTEMPEIDLFGLKISILSPTPENQENLNTLWLAEEKKGKLGRSSDKADHAKTIEELKNTPFYSDTDQVNASSIALLIRYKDITCLLLADSHSSEIENRLTALSYSKDMPLDATIMHLAHHGSKANTSLALLNMVRTNDFVITGNGIHNRHPDKETLVRVLVQEHRNGAPINLHFSCNNKELQSLFAVDQNPFERYNFTCSYRDLKQNGIGFSYLPLNNEE